MEESIKCLTNLLTVFTRRNIKCSPLPKWSFPTLPPRICLGDIVCSVNSSADQQCTMGEHTDISDIGLFLTNLNRHSLILAAFWPRQRWCNQIYHSPIGCWDLGVWQYQEYGLGRQSGNNIAKNISSQLKNIWTIL